MARDLGRSFRAITPTDTFDPARFGQVVETTKDAFVESLREFFARSRQSNERRGEVPVVEKYATTMTPDDPHTTAVNIFQRHPEAFERMPMVVVMSAQGSQKPMSIGPPSVTVVQHPPRIRFPLSAPYVLAQGDILEVRVLLPNKRYLYNLIEFQAERFPSGQPINMASAADVARAINENAIHVQAYVVTVNGEDFVELHAKSSQTETDTPLEIEIGPKTSANVLLVTGAGRGGNVLEFSRVAAPAVQNMIVSLPEGSVTQADVGRFICTVSTDNPYFNTGRFPIISVTNTVGQPDTVVVNYRRALAEAPVPPATTVGTWFIGLRDDHKNPLRPPMMRYFYASDLSVQISILANDELVRKELHDLVNAYLSFFLEERFFTFNGRSDVTNGAADPLPNESYQITIRQPVRHSGESEVPRPGDLNDRVYIGSHTVDVTTSWYVDRELYFDGTNTPRIVTEDMLVQSGAPLREATRAGEAATVTLGVPSGAGAGGSGIVGPPGPQGPQGPPGPQGPAGTIIFEGGAPDRGPGSIVFSLDLGGVT